MKSVKILTILLTMFLSMSVDAQTLKEREIIKSRYLKKDLLNQIKKDLLDTSIQRKNRIEAFLKSHPLSSRKIIGSQIVELIDVRNDVPIYYTTDNDGSSKTIRTNRLYSGGTLGLNIQGLNMIGGIWDGGGVRSSHIELTGRALGGGDTPSSVADHATHVAGTMIGSGSGSSNARGIAFEGSVFFYDWTDDTLELVTSIADDGILVSNHSYGYSTAGLPAWYFGAYDSEARDFDNIIYNSGYISICKSAGNDRDSWNSLNPSKNKYELITGFGNSKNTITVAAVNQLLNYTTESDVVMSTFSNWGPTDDGRIKPDISAKGVNTYSCTASSNTSHATYSGTSMASPAIAGMIMLLQQHYNNLNANYMRSATVKGLILHTADEAGSDIGPDYSFGWGLANAEKAAIAISNRNLPSNGSIIDELNLAQGASYTRTVTANGSTPLQVSISWTDPASPNVNAGVTDPTTLYLVNDLDVKVTKNGVDYYPWKLDKAIPAAGATNTTTNDIDNFERVDIENPAGTYTVTVSHKGTLTNGSQNYTLIITGPSLTLGVDDITNSQNSFTIYPNPVKDVLSIKMLDNTAKTEITVFDMLGTQILQKKFDASNNTNINVSSLQKGAYIVRVKQNNTVSTQKFIKE